MRRVWHAVAAFGILLFSAVHAWGSDLPDLSHYIRVNEIACHDATGQVIGILASWSRVPLDFERLNLMPEEMRATVEWDFAIVLGNPQNGGKTLEWILGTDGPREHHRYAVMPPGASAWVALGADAEAAKTRALEVFSREDLLVLSEGCN